ncbi:hydrogenase maturation nickel metallochaperone HypA [archaeon]|nr:hydrogenase maturation nickel metallochaperone HypA [archaeon]
MHELGMAMEIVEVVIKSLEGRKVNGVKEVEIELGELHKISPEQMRQVFEMAAKDTIVEGAKLKVKIKKGKIRCQSCGYSGGVKVAMKHDHDHIAHIHCPECEGVSIEILEGNDIDVRNITADVED